LFRSRGLTETEVSRILVEGAAIEARGHLRRADITGDGHDLPKGNLAVRVCVSERTTLQHGPSVARLDGIFHFDHILLDRGDRRNELERRAGLQPGRY